MFKIWLIRERCWATGDYTDLEVAITEAQLLETPCSIQEFTQGRYVAILEVNV